MKIEMKHSLLDEFDERFASKLGIRAPTMRLCIERLLLRQRPPVIVETGTLRVEDNWAGDGQSTLIWDWFAEARRGTVWSVDIDPAAVALARSLTGPRVVTVLGDSIEFLRRFPGNIDLLYLDTVAHDDGGSVHCMAEFRAAQSLLGGGSTVMIDDSCVLGTVPTGKGKLVAVALRNATRLADGPQQLVWAL